MSDKYGIAVAALLRIAAVTDMGDSLVKCGSCCSCFLTNNDCNDDDECVASIARRVLDQLGEEWRP